MSLNEAARLLLGAADRLRDHWAESDETTRTGDLWRPLHMAADTLRAEIETHAAVTTLATAALIVEAGTEDLSDIPGDALVRARDTADRLVRALNVEVLRRNTDPPT